MELIFGTLSIDEPNLTSLLVEAEASDNWLLLSGFPDPYQAGRAATNFIVNTRHLSSGVAVAVTGTRSTIGTQPVVTMTDISAAGSLMQHALASMKEGKAASAGPRNLRKKSGTSKKNAGRKIAVRKAKPGEPA